MDGLSAKYLLEALEEVKDYYEFLEHQDKINHTIVRHSLDALHQIFTTYQKEHTYK